MAVDVLINNAGVYNDRGECASGDEACPGDWSTQSFGQMSFELLDTIMDVNIKGATFYRMSKAALNREMQIVAASVKADGVTVVILNPGPTLTERQAYLRGNPIMIEASFTVENMIRTIEKTTLAESGRFLRYDGAPEPW